MCLSGFSQWVSNNIFSKDIFGKIWICRWHFQCLRTKQNNQVATKFCLETSLFTPKVASFSFLFRCNYVQKFRAGGNTLDFRGNTKNILTRVNAGQQVASRKLRAARRCGKAWRLPHSKTDCIPEAPNGSFTQRSFHYSACSRSIHSYFSWWISTHAWIPVSKVLDSEGKGQYQMINSKVTKPQRDDYGTNHGSFTCTQSHFITSIRQKWSWLCCFILHQTDPTS